MKAIWIMLLASGLSACATDEEPAQGELQLAEIIEVHGCRPGTWEVGEGDDRTCIYLDPGWGGGGGDYGHVPREEIPRGGGGGGGGGRPVGTPVAGEPGVMVYQFSLGTFICKSVCTALSYTICRGVELACAVGSTFTLGGLVLPCVGIIPAACLAGIFGGAACSELLCEDKE